MTIKIIDERILTGWVPFGDLHVGDPFKMGNYKDLFVKTPEAHNYHNRMSLSNGGRCGHTGDNHIVHKVDIEIKIVG